MSLRSLASSLGSSRRLSSFLSTSSERERREEDGGGETWQQHPLQDNACTVEVLVSRTEQCLQAARKISHGKKKRVSGFREVERTLGQLESKLKAEGNVLSKHGNSGEIKQSMMSLQDILISILRKFGRIAKRKYFLDAAYGKKMLLMHQSLNSAISETFLSLSRRLITNSIESRRGSLESTASFIWKMANEARSTTDRTGSSISSSRRSSMTASDFELLEEEEGKEEEKGSLTCDVIINNEHGTPLPVKRLRKGTETPEEMHDQAELLLLREKNFRMALILFARAAEQEYTPSMLALGKLYEKGFGTEGQDIDLALHFYMCAEDLENSEGSTALALLRLRNLNFFAKSENQSIAQVQKDAIRLLTKSAFAGSAEASCCLGELIHAKNPKSGSKARTLFANAAAQGHARAQNNLAVILLSESDEEEALRLLELSASQGFAKAQNNLALQLERKGRLQEAKVFYRQAVEAGEGQAMFNLGSLLVEENLFDEGLRLLESAACVGIKDAHLLLGFLYEKRSEEALAEQHFRLGGDFVHRGCIALKNRDFSKAAALFSEAARRRNPAALEALSKMSAKGLCIPGGLPDERLATELFKAAQKLRSSFTV